NSIPPPYPGGLGEGRLKAVRQLAEEGRRMVDVNEDGSFVFFFKQKTAYEIGLGIPAEPLFRSVQQTYKHSVPRFFVPEHGTMFTLALVRFPPTATKEIQYLNAKGALTYTDIAGDPVLYGNLPPRE